MILLVSDWEKGSYRTHFKQIFSCKTALTKAVMAYVWQDVSSIYYYQIYDNLNWRWTKPKSCESIDDGILKCTLEFKKYNYTQDQRLMNLL